MSDLEHEDVSQDPGAFAALKIKFRAARDIRLSPG